ncbi:MAG: bifunctional nuclease family protein [Fibrobacter sp.]|jgi:bifunctional DNase/RNase|nr:bifunctional nuclease family protein [Fibrobacter sp.]
MLVQVEIASFAMDTSRNSPVIILKEVSGKRTLPVPIGPLEASAIAIESLNVTPEKPLTIDLVKIVLEQMGGALSRVVIYDVQEQSLLCRLQVANGRSVLFIDCRPSDAIALALRCGSPVFVQDSVMEKFAPEKMSEAEKLRNNIASIDTTEFGRFFLE